jgi:hypothetical protein
MRDTVMTNLTLLVLPEFSFALGLIDVNEYMERRKVAHWLADDDPAFADPREPSSDEREGPRREQADPPSNSAATQITGTGKPDDPDWLKLLVLGKWMFTRSDRDSYPSTPHGHLHNANRRWPKLNPYTGRVFKAKHQEDTTLRLTKHEMRELWRTEAFRDFCRSYILWYVEAHPHHAFAIRNPLRFPVW